MLPMSAASSFTPPRPPGSSSAIAPENEERLARGSVCVLLLVAPCFHAEFLQWMFVLQITPAFCSTNKRLALAYCSPTHMSLLTRLAACRSGSETNGERQPQLDIAGGDNSEQMVSNNNNVALPLEQIGPNGELQPQLNIAAGANRNKWHATTTTQHCRCKSDQMARYINIAAGANRRPSVPIHPHKTTEQL
jgi:hypothetical protein